MQTGRDRNRMFQRIAVALALAVSLGYPLAASAQAPTRPAQPLPGLGGGFSIAHDINEASVIVGEASNAANRTRAVSWTNGVIRDLGTLGGNESRALGVSNRGQIVGSSSPASNDRTLAFIWDQGVMTALPALLGATVSEANDVNDSGIAVGFSGNTAVFWQNGQVNVLPGIGGTPTRAVRISAGGVVVGTVTSSSGSFQSAIIWRLPSLATTNLGTLPGGTQSFGFDVNDSIQAAGTSTINPTGSPVHAFLWTNGVRLDLGTLISGPSASSQAFGLSASGLVCGEGSALDAGGNTTTHGLLWDYNRQVVDLLPLAGNSFSTANAVNSGGTVVGHSSSPTQPRAVFWRF
jgi:probable HAF family extracellular repeat protein